MPDLTPVAEQTRIVEGVGRRLSLAEGLEAVVSANLQRATRLRQSILQKAFIGNLTLQMKPSIFIGSSSEALPLANAVKNELAKHFNADLWSENLFELGEDTLNNLLRFVQCYDFAVLVLTDDDQTMTGSGNRTTTITACRSTCLTPRVLSKTRPSGLDAEFRRQLIRQVEQLPPRRNRHQQCRRPFFHRQLGHRHRFRITSAEAPRFRTPTIISTTA